ncbi:MAG: 50S ribosomal protein L6 [Candidatus Omnitrophota bacterium]
MSLIGKKPVSFPKEVKVTVENQTIKIEGPKGKLSQALPQGISVDIKDNAVWVKRQDDSKQDKSNHGTIRALIANMVKGVTEGYVKDLEIQGVGFRAQVAGNVLTMNLGFTHPVNFIFPAEITVTTTKPTLIKVAGIDKCKVGEIAANIRKIYKAEPYKGKGIRYAGEVVRRKQGKAVTK